MASAHRLYLLRGRRWMCAGRCQRCAFQCHASFRSLSGSPARMSDAAATSSLVGGLPLVWLELLRRLGRVIAMAAADSTGHGGAVEGVRERSNAYVDDSHTDTWPVGAKGSGC